MGERYTDLNAKTIDKWCAEGWEWGKPAPREQFVRAKQGDWQVLLTPCVPVPRAWFGDIRGKKLLGLASGGAQQMPLFAAAGAVCTVMDYSPAQIQSERDYAAREGYKIDIIRGDMTLPFPFADGAFDIIFNPVSNCYVRDLQHVWGECARVLKKGGVLLTGFDNGINYFFRDDNEREVVNHMPFDPLADEEQMRQCVQDDVGVQFSHSLESQLGGMLRAGFRICDLYEDTNGQGYLHELNIKTMMAVRCIKE